MNDIRIGSDSERGTPFLCDDFRKACHTGFGKAIVGLTAVGK